MGRLLAALLAIVIALAGCSDADTLTDSEAMWCRAAQPGYRMLEAGDAMGVDLTDVYQQAELIGDASGTPEERQNAIEDAFDLLEGDAGYVEVCRTLYDDAGRPFDLRDDLP
jgi:hypothetical protein